MPSVNPPAKRCPFCAPPPDQVLIDGSVAMVLTDTHPLNPGHVLIVPRRHVASWFDSTTAEREEILRLADDARRMLASNTLRTHSISASTTAPRQGSRCLTFTCISFRATAATFPIRAEACGGSFRHRAAYWRKS